MYAQYGEDGLESLKTINLFGNSSNPDSPYYDNQMDMFVNKQVKNVELDLDKIKEKAKRVYHPK